MKKNLNAVYVMHSIFGLAGSLIGIFVPAYLITLGYVPRDVFLYSFIHAISVFVFFCGAGLLAKRTGVRLLVIASFPFTLGYIMLMYTLHTTVLPLPLIASVQGAGIGLYWFSLHSFFATNASKKTIGSSVGKLFGFPQIVGLFAPLLGGLIATHYGFPVLFIFGGCILLSSAIPLLWIPELKVAPNLNFSKLIALFQKFKRYTFVEFFEDIREELEAIVWPLFIFLTFKNTLSVGLIGTFAAVGSILFTLLVGRYTDRINPKIFMRIGAIFMTAIWLVRFVWPNIPLLLYTSSILEGLIACLIIVPFTSYIYSAAKQTNVTEFIVYREFPVTLARIAIYGGALLLVTNVSDLFLIGAVASAFILLF